MSNLSTHVVYTRHGQSSLMEWVEGHKHRNHAYFDELGLLEKIARHDGGDAKDLMLSLFDTARTLRNTVDEVHREFDTLGEALRKIADSETAGDQV